MLTQYVQYFANRIRRRGREASAGQWITVVALLCIVAGVMAALYALFTRGFSAVAANEFFATALPIFVYELSFLVVFVLVALSTIISGIVQLFSGRGDMWIMVSPQHSTIMAYKFMSIAALSLWPLVIIALPAVAAMAVVYEISAFGITLAVVAMVLLGINTVLASLLLLLLMGWALCVLGPDLSKRMGWLVALVGGIAIGAFGYLAAPFRSVSLLELFAVRDLDITTAPIDEVLALFAHVPSHHAALVLAHVQLGDLVSAFAGVVALTLFFVGLAVIYVGQAPRFIQLWQYFQEGDTQARTRTARQGTPKAGFAFSTNQLIAIAQKESLTLFRNQRDILWLVFLLVLWSIVVFLDTMVQDNIIGRFATDASFAAVVLAVQFVVVAYFVAAIVLRFIFPSFSLERGTAWVIMSAPISLQRLFWGKALFSLSIVAGLGLLMAGVTLLASGVSADLPMLATFIAFVLGYALVVVWVGFTIGVRFPNFATDDPQQLATSLSGLSFTAIALVYGGVAGYVLFLVLLGGGVGPLVAFLLGTAVLVWWSGRSALRQLPKTEFVRPVTS